MTPNAKTTLALLLLEGGKIERDFTEACRLLREAAEAGHGPAATQLGHLYSGNFGRMMKPRMLSNGMVKLRETGQIAAQYALGVLHLNGMGVIGNVEHAANLFKQAAKAGHAGCAISSWSHVLHRARSEKGLCEGVAWYRKAAQRGHKIAQYNFAVMLAQGKAVTQIRQSRYLVRKSSETGIIGSAGRARRLLSPWKRC